MQGLEFCGLVYSQQYMILHLRLLWVLVRMVSLVQLHDSFVLLVALINSYLNSQ